MPFRINPRYNKTDFILLAGHSVVIAAVGDCVDDDMEPDKDGAFVDVRDRSGVFALNIALAEVFLAGVANDAFNVSFYGDFLKGMDFDAQDVDRDLPAHMEAFRGISQSESG